MTRDYTRWSQEDKMALVRATVTILAAHFKIQPSEVVDGHTMFRGFFSNIFSKAMDQGLQADQWRSIKQHKAVPWFLPLLRDYTNLLREQAAPAPEPVPQTAIVQPEQDQKLIDRVVPLVVKEVVRMLAELYDLTEILPTREKAAPNRVCEIPAPAPERRPRVAVYGVQTSQMPELQRAWGSRFDLRCKEATKHSRVQGVDGCDYAVGLVSNLPHEVDVKLSRMFGKSYIRTNGGLTSVKKALNDLCGRIDLVRLSG